MKKSKNLWMVMIMIVTLSSCGINKSVIFNQNQNTTQVLLSQDNFKITGQAKGSSDVSYVLLFGARKKKELYREAYQNMLENADLRGGSRAITNVLTEEHIGGILPFYYTRTVTVTANVVEFTK